MVEIFDNIRKIYRFSNACPELAEYIEFFAESAGGFISGDQVSVKMFASWTPTFFINLGTPYLINLGNRQHSVGAGRDIAILRDGLVERIKCPGDHLFTVKFYPGGLEAVLGISQLGLADRPVDLAALLPYTFLAQLHQALTFDERCLWMEQYLLGALVRRKKQDHYLSFVRDYIGMYQAGGMQQRISGMADQAFVQAKTVNRYFKRVVGIAPKSYFSILRARSALTAYVESPAGFTPPDFGYYDMSHFYKAIRCFTGDKLTDHMKARKNVS